jgi:predicted enzyme related to lactoylglutathione lyase
MQQALIVFAKDKERLSLFYRKVLALDLGETSDTHDLLLGRGIEILIHAVPRRFAEGIDIASPPKPRAETPFKPVFWVADFESVRAAAKETGGFLDLPDKAWNFGGATILDGWDPEGNVVQFRLPGSSNA